MPPACMAVWHLVCPVSPLNARLSNSVPHFACQAPPLRQLYFSLSITLTFAPSKVVGREGGSLWVHNLRGPKTQPSGSQLLQYVKNKKECSSTWNKISKL